MQFCCWPHSGCQHRPNPTHAAPSLLQGPGWSAQFYNNIYLSGDPAYIAQYPSLAFDWGAGTAGPGVNNDYFSARFASDPYFEPGPYRFFILADDAVQLWIDFSPSKQPEFSNFNNPQPGQIVAYDAVLTGGTHHIQFDYREFTGGAYLYVTWVNLATNPNPTPNFPTPTQAPVSVIGGSWTGQYYTDAYLSGLPAITVQENSPAHNWGEGAPTAGIPADYFSARWTTTVSLNTGTYQVTARADDGIRVYVNAQLLINEFHTASGQTYSMTFSLPAGTHTVTVEYYEATGTAFLDFSMTTMPTTQPTGGTTGQPVPNTPGTAVATVTAYRLNVRNQPNPLTGLILMKINRSETYPVVGRNAAGTWWQLNVNGQYGWVNGSYISVSNAQTVPVTDSTYTPPQQQQPPSSATLTALLNVNIRSGPGLQYSVIGRLPYHQAATVVGRNTDGSWYQIQYGSIIGWVSSLYVDLSAGTNPNSIPLVG